MFLWFCGTLCVLALLGLVNCLHLIHVTDAEGTGRCILGPLLFNININDLITVSNKLHFIMYADDTTIYFNLEDFNQENLETEVNNELSRVSEWMTLNKLSLNASKTQNR